MAPVVDARVQYAGWIIGVHRVTGRGQNDAVNGREGCAAGRAVGSGACIEGRYAGLTRSDQLTKIAGTHSYRGHCVDGEAGVGNGLAGAMVVAEQEKMVLPNWTAQGRAKLVTVEAVLRRAGAEVVGIGRTQGGVTVELPRGNREYDSCRS